MEFPVSIPTSARRRHISCIPWCVSHSKMGMTLSYQTSNARTAELCRRVLRGIPASVSSCDDSPCFSDAQVFLVRVLANALPEENHEDRVSQRSATTRVSL